MADYDEIGANYSEFRREDPFLVRSIAEALTGCESVVNVGAGPGSYEPAGISVTAVEPSAVMRAQRPPGSAPAIAASAESLPFADDSFDAAMAVLSLHHWHPNQALGVRELQRVGGLVLIVTVDPLVSGDLWLSQYLPEVAELDRRIFPAPAEIASWLGGDVSTQPLLVSRDTPDWMLLSYWAHPERMLDAAARRATSGLARLPTDVVDRAVAEIDADLVSGAWDRKWGHLRGLDSYDAGLRLIVGKSVRFLNQ